MPREARSIEPGTTYHLISRFVDREWFITKPDERANYIRLLGLALDESDWRLYSYAIMSNHIHLQALAGEQPLEEWIRCVHSPLANAMNRAYNRIGPMFVRGPKAHHVHPDRFGALLAYIHNNPVRAGTCTAAAASDWTSHRAYIGRARVPTWLHVDEGLRRAGVEDSAAFDTWVNDPARFDTDSLFLEEQYEQEAACARAAERANRKRRRAKTATAIVTATSAVLGVSLQQLQSNSRAESLVIGREVVARCALNAGISGRAIARLLRKSEWRISRFRREAPPGVRAICSEVLGAAQVG